MEPQKTYYFQSKSTLHNNHLSAVCDSKTIYFIETQLLNSNNFKMDLSHKEKSQVTATAKATLTGDRCLVSLRPSDEDDKWIHIRRTPPDESIEFILNGIKYAWKCTSNVLGVRTWDLIETDSSGGRRLATFSKTRGMLVRRKMGTMSFVAALDSNLEHVAILAVMANQERIRRNTSPSSGGGGGGFAGG